MPEYNGHRSWNAWNVALWIGNDEVLYRFAIGCLERRDWNIARATNLFMVSMGGEKTPDGAIFNRTCVREALAGLAEDR